MAGKKVKHTQKHQDRVPRNWTKRQMILDRVGQSVYMRDRRDRRALEGEKDWEQEDWGD